MGYTGAFYQPEVMSVTVATVARLAKSANSATSSLTLLRDLLSAMVLFTDWTTFVAKSRRSVIASLKT